MKPLTLIGIVLMVAAFAILGIFIVIPAVLPTLDSAPFIKNTLQAVLCKPGGSLTAQYSGYDTPGESSRSVYMACESPAGQAEDVSGKGIGIGFVGYIVPFLLGLFLTMAGAAQKRRDQTPGGDVPMFTARSFVRRGSSFNGQRGDVTVTSDGTVYSSQPSYIGQEHGSGTAHIPLAQRLSELKAAYGAGLITQAEYNSMRKELLSEM